MVLRTATSAAQTWGAEINRATAAIVSCVSNLVTITLRSGVWFELEGGEVAGDLGDGVGRKHDTRAVQQTEHVELEFMLHGLVKCLR